MSRLSFLKDGMIGKGSGFNNSITNFLPEESEGRFLKALETEPKDWIYRTETITYQYNNHGHRCIEINDLSEGYILFAGCSHTEGIGLKLERTYPYLVSQHYQRPYYNLALGGTGPDVVMFNIMGFLSKVKIKPSVVVIQWPDFSRFFHINKDWFMNLYMASAATNIIFKYMITNDIPYRQNVFYRYNTLQHLSNYGIQHICEETVESDGDTAKVKFPNFVDRARDLSHGGNITNELRAKNIIEVLDKNFAHVLKM